MPLAARTRLGPYEILAPLGAGGLGEVCRARATRLERTVAVKVLQSHLPSSEEVRASVPASGKWQISTAGGDQPAWRRDGRELLYISLDRRMMSVSMNVGSTFEAGVPKALFAAPVPGMGVSSDRTHDAVTADGQRFLVRKVLEEKAPPPITIILDWTAELKK